MEDRETKRGARGRCLYKTSQISAEGLTGFSGPVFFEGHCDIGVGGNALIGGSNISIALQPLSVQGQVDLSVAAGLESLELRSGR